MPDTLKETIYAAFSVIDDPRAANASHPLVDVLFCIIVAVACGADSLVAAEQIAIGRKAFIKRYVPLRRGVPSHNTMGLVLASIDPKQFAAALAVFMGHLAGRPRRDIINLDGKSLRGVVGAKNTRNPEAVAEQVHMVSAFSVLRQIVLGQVRSASVANEVEAAHELLKIIELKGATVTLDAAHTNRECLKIIDDRGGDVVVTVKGNTKKLQTEIEEAFRKQKPRVITTTERTHGATETRTYEFVAASGDSVETTFKTLKTFVRVTRDNVSHASQQQREDAETYYATSLEDDERAASCIRSRWGIENQLHYVLDVTFNEDGCRVRAKNAAENFSRIRHIVLGLLKTKKTAKATSVPIKRLLTAMDDRYLASVLRLPVVTTEMG